MLLVLLALISLTAYPVKGYNVYTYHGPPAPLAHDGKVIETPEVAHARATHLAVHAEAIAKIASGGIDSWPVHEDEIGGNDIEEEKNQFGDDGLKYVYHGPPAPLGKDGRVVDTPEVAHAKAAHLEAFAKAYAKAPKGEDPADKKVWENDNDHLSGSPIHVPHTIYHLPKVYKGPPAPLGHDGRVLDTPEVVHARVAHLRAHVHAHAATAINHPDYENRY